MMDFQEYENLSSRTMNVSLPTNGRLEMLVYGLNGETGELTDMIKKWRFHGHPIDRQDLASELGDILWYLTQLCIYFKQPLSEVARLNISKLKARYPEGFSEEASRNRA